MAQAATPQPSAAPVAILIGPPGAGKTTVGQLLAARLGVGFTDTDAEVEATAGKPVSDIFVEDGEPAFRELERAAVELALGTATGVVAIGGGAVLDPARPAGRLPGDGLRGGSQAGRAEPGPPAADRQPQGHAEDPARPAAAGLPAARGDHGANRRPRAGGHRGRGRRPPGRPVTPSSLRPS